MFTFTGLSVKQCAVLTEKHHVYLLSNGRISMCGINSKNVDCQTRTHIHTLTGHGHDEDRCATMMRIFVES
jgi:aspartate/tyrosine/aromatic aminotransferase